MRSTSTTGTLEVFSSWFDGPGHIELAPDTLLLIRGNAPTVLRSDLVGLGDVLIDLGHELRIEAGAVVDLSGDIVLPGCADPNASAQWGTITVDGELFVRGGTIQNTNVTVTLADFSNSAELINNDISLLNASAGFGGQFFVEGSSVIQCNAITSDGDRYLDLDPDPTADPRPLILDNQFEVFITQGTGGEAGEILELRIEDVDCDPAVNEDRCPSGAIDLSSSLGYGDTWALERLETLPGAKVTLTNRQRLVFQDSSVTTPETVYVKDLILGTDSVLNTGFQRLYYQGLTDEFGQPLVRDPGDPSAPMANGSRIVDVPLLGFSLGIIEMNDDTEFEVRVQRRITDPKDQDPEDPTAPLPAGTVQREVGLRPENPDDGVLDMQTRMASSISAKGAFARATADNVIVSFDYLFRDNPNAELIVYLSDTAAASKTGCTERPCCHTNDNNDDNRNRCEIARVFPPAEGQPGAIDSDEFAFFHGSFPRGSLDFIRGAYVELELRNPGSRVWIDRWDPAECCGTCGGFQGCEVNVVTEADYLYLLSEYGQQVRGVSSKECVDSLLNDDGHVDISDLLAWELYYEDEERLTFCSDGSVAQTNLTTGVGVTLPPESSLLVAGKQGAGREDFLYALKSNGTCVGERLSPASAPTFNGYRANGRMVRDGSGELYQLHGDQGLIRLSDAQAVIAPQVASSGGQIVHVGVTGLDENGDERSPVGVPLLDVAFDPVDSMIAYIVPVLVDPPSGAICPDGSTRIKPYKAAARIRLTDGPEGFLLEELYGSAPCPGDGICNTDPCSSSPSSIHRLREIELDGFGNVLVTSSQVNNDSWLLVHNNNSQGEQIRIPLLVASPTAMTVSQSGDTLYVASSLDTDLNSSQFFRYRIDHIDETVSGIQIEDVIEIDQLKQITSIAENPIDGSLWVLGFNFPERPFLDSDTFCNSPGYPPGCLTSNIFTTPKFAVVSPDSATVMLSDITCHDLALPLSMVFSANVCPPSPPVVADVSKLRHLGFDPSSASGSKAIRVTMSDMPIPFDVVNDLAMWVTNPIEVCENSGQGTAQPLDQMRTRKGATWFPLRFQVVQLFSPLVYPVILFI